MDQTNLRDETTVKMDLEATGEQEYAGKHSSPSVCSNHTGQRKPDDLH